MAEGKEAQGSHACVTSSHPRHFLNSHSLCVQCSRIFLGPEVGYPAMWETVCGQTRVSCQAFRISGDTYLNPTGSEAMIQSTSRELSQPPSSAPNTPGLGVWYGSDPRTEILARMVMSRRRKGRGRRKEK